MTDRLIRREYARLAPFAGRADEEKLPATLDRIVQRHLDDIQRLASEDEGKYHRKHQCPQGCGFTVLYHTGSGVWACTRCGAGGADYWAAAQKLQGGK